VFAGTLGGGGGETNIEKRPGIRGGVWGGRGPIFGLGGEGKGRGGGKGGETGPTMLMHNPDGPEGDLGQGIIGGNNDANRGEEERMPQPGRK